MQYDKNIINWINSKLSTGIQREQIENYLIQQGYSKEQILYLFSQVNNFNSTKIELKKKSIYRFELIFYLISAFLFFLLNYLIGKFMEGFIFFLLYLVIYFFNLNLFNKNSSYLKYGVIISNIIYSIYFLFLIPEFLIPLIVANIFTIHYYLNTRKKYFYDKINLIFLSTHLIIIILLIFSLYLLGITFFNLFDIIHLGQLFLLLAILKYIGIILFFYISVFLIFTLFGEFSFEAYFKFNSKNLRFLNYFSTRENNTVKSIFKVSNIYFLIFIIPSVFISTFFGISYYNDVLSQNEAQHSDILDQLELNYYKDLYFDLDILNNYDEFYLRKVSKDIISENPDFFLNYFLLQNGNLDLNKVYSDCNYKLICQRNSLSVPTNFFQEISYILLGTKNNKLDIYFLRKENESTIKNRELVILENDNLKQTLIYKEINSKYKQLLSEIYSREIYNKTNIKMIIDFFKGDYQDKMSSDILYIINVSVEFGDIYNANNIMIKEYSLIRDSYYNISIDKSPIKNSFNYEKKNNNQIIEELYSMRKITKARKLMLENYYSNQNSNQVLLSNHIKNLNNELSKLDSLKEIKNNNNNSFNNIHGENMSNSSLPIEYLFDPIVSKIDLIKHLEDLELEIRNLTKKISNRYNNLENDENEISRVIRLSILIDRSDNFT